METKIKLTMEAENANKSMISKMANEDDKNVDVNIINDAEGNVELSNDSIDKSLNMIYQSKGVSPENNNVPLADSFSIEAFSQSMALLTNQTDQHQPSTKPCNYIDELNLVNNTKTQKSETAEDYHNSDNRNQTKKIVVQPKQATVTKRPIEKYLSDINQQEYNPYKVIKGSKERKKREKNISEKIEGGKSSDSEKFKSNGSSDGSVDSTGNPVVKDQVKAVVGDLENVLGELKTVVGDLRDLVDQIDAVTTKIDEEYGAEDVPGVKLRHEAKSELDKQELRRRSVSILENGTPKKDVPAPARHSVSQPFDSLKSGKDWVFSAPPDFASRHSDSPRHSQYSNSSVVRRRDEQLICQAHRSQLSCERINDNFDPPIKDDIIICTPGSVCHKRYEVLMASSNSLKKKSKSHAIDISNAQAFMSPSKRNNNVPKHIRTSSESETNTLGKDPYQSPFLLRKASSKSNVTAKELRSKSLSISGSRDSDLNCAHKQKVKSPQTSNSSGIGNSFESGNAISPTKITTEHENESHNTSQNYQEGKQEGQTKSSTETSQPGNNGSREHISNDKNDVKRHYSPCASSPDSDYCGVYEKELELQLELVIEEQDDLPIEEQDDPRSLNLQPYPGYGPSYVDERISKWAAYTVLKIGTYPLSDDQLTEAQSEASSDVLNDGSIMSLTPASEENLFLGTHIGRKIPWSMVFPTTNDENFPNPDTG